MAEPSSNHPTLLSVIDRAFTECISPAVASGEALLTGLRDMLASKEQEVACVRSFEAAHAKSALWQCVLDDADPRSEAADLGPLLLPLLEWCRAQAKIPPAAQRDIDQLYLAAMKLPRRVGVPLLRALLTLARKVVDTDAPRAPAHVPSWMAANVPAAFNPITKLAGEFMQDPEQLPDLDRLTTACPDGESLHSDLQGVFQSDSLVARVLEQASSVDGLDLHAVLQGAFHS